MEMPKTPTQWYAGVAGVFLVALGVLSLTILPVEFAPVDETTTPEFLIWQANGWTTLLWLALGAVGLVMMSRVDGARSYSLVAGVAFSVLAVWGFIDGQDVASLFYAGTTNNITHAILGGLGLMAGLPSERQQRKAGLGRAGDPRGDRAPTNTRNPGSAPPSRV